MSQMFLWAVGVPKSACFEGLVQGHVHDSFQLRKGLRFVISQDGLVLVSLENMIQNMIFVHYCFAGTRVDNLFITQTPDLSSCCSSRNLLHSLYIFWGQYFLKVRLSPKLVFLRPHINSLVTINKPHSASQVIFSFKLFLKLHCSQFPRVNLLYSD